jgi:cobalt-zinc-cadmium efflux system outer membrane protein
MIPIPRTRLALRPARLACLCWLAWACLGGLDVTAAPPCPAEPLPPALTLGAAVRWALRYNPEMAALRQQHGIAAAGVVIANTYPFNPVSENRAQDVAGPGSSGTTNIIGLEHLLLWEVEVRHQRSYRREGAKAALTRTDWQIARQEQMLVAHVVRAFTTLLWREAQQQQLEETLALNQRLTAQVRKLVDQGQLRSADLIVAQTEITTSRDLVAGAVQAVVAARYDLYRALGIVDDKFHLDAVLAVPSLELDGHALLEDAMAHRGDLYASRAAVAEAQARLQLEIANRYGNPTLGVAYNYDNTRANWLGPQINFPIPVANTHRGDILQREAERDRVALELRQTEVLVQQDVTSALARLESAQARMELYRTRILPDLRKGIEDMQSLFLAGTPGVDILRVIDVRRKYLGALATYLDVLFTVHQARADIIEAVGDLELLGINPCDSGPVAQPAGTETEVLPLPSPGDGKQPKPEGAK